MLNIITRTSQRPNYFKNCRKSVLKQKGDFKHWVTYDNEETLKYLKEQKVENLIQAHKPQKGNCPWNDYLNQAVAKIKKGWVCILDDDDYIVDESFTLTLNKKLKNLKQVAFWRVGFPGGALIPDNRHWKKKPVSGQISMIGMAFNLSWIDTIGPLWDDRCMGDYRLAKRLWEADAEIVWIDKKLTALARPNVGGHGKKDDLKS